MVRSQELCESGGGRPGLPVPNGPYGLCGRKATLNSLVRGQELCESRGGRPDSSSLTVLMVFERNATPQEEESTWSKLRRCVRVEVAVLGSPSLIAVMVSVDVKQHLKKQKKRSAVNRLTVNDVFKAR